MGILTATAMIGPLVFVKLVTKEQIPNLPLILSNLQNVWKVFAIQHQVGGSQKILDFEDRNLLKQAKLLAK